MSFFFLSAGLTACLLSHAQVDYTSYVNKSGEKIRQLTMAVPVNLNKAWELFYRDAKLSA
ncbi:MAG: hypothetical protein H7258_15545 [Ferruginibacter sp.]|nr:hypothetical protein [Ferruginibacter sp.]